MKRIRSIAGIFLLFIAASLVQGQNNAAVFKTHCGACHSVGGGRLVGPDLAGINQKRDKAWIEQFIRNSVSMIQAGDPQAMAIGKEYNNMLMPPFNGSAADLAAIMKHLEDAGGTVGKSAVADTFLNAASAANADRGRLLFTGQVSFVKGGPACISCHNTLNSPVPGGTLSKSLNLSYAFMKGAGIKALLQSPPFPAMAGSYGTRPLTDQEVYDLSAYLRNVAKEQIEGKSAGAELPFFLMGGGGTLLIIALYWGLWMRRKRRSLNHDIFARQLVTGV